MCLCPGTSSCFVHLKLLIRPYLHIDAHHVSYIEKVSNFKERKN